MIINPTVAEINKLKVSDLKKELKDRGLPRTGREADLKKRLIDAIHKQEIDELQDRIEEGHTMSMVQLGHYYAIGDKGLKKDPKQAFQLYKMASDLKYPPGMAWCGSCLVRGAGVPQDCRTGVSLVAKAANKRSNHAAHLMGSWHANGSFGLCKDLGMTRFYWKQIFNDPPRYYDVPAECLEDACAWLAESS